MPETINKPTLSNQATLMISKSLKEAPAKSRPYSKVPLMRFESPESKLIVLAKDLLLGIPEDHFKIIECEIIQKKIETFDQLKASLVFRDCVYELLRGAIVLIANRIFKTNITDRYDYEQQAWLLLFKPNGLLDKYNPNLINIRTGKPYPLSHFVNRIARQELQTLRNANYGSVVMPSQVGKHFFVGSCTHELSAEIGRTPNIKELSEYMNKMRPGTNWELYLKNTYPLVSKVLPGRYLSLTELEANQLIAPETSLIQLANNSKATVKEIFDIAESVYKALTINLLDQKHKLDSKISVEYLRSIKADKEKLTRINRKLQKFEKDYNIYKDYLERLIESKDNQYGSVEMGQKHNSHFSNISKIVTDWNKLMKAEMLK